MSAHPLGTCAGTTGPGRATRMCAIRCGNIGASPTWPADEHDQRIAVPVNELVDLRRHPPRDQPIAPLPELGRDITPGQPAPEPVDDPLTTRRSSRSGRPRRPTDRVRQQRGHSGPFIGQDNSPRHRSRIAHSATLIEETRPRCTYTVYRVWAPTVMVVPAVTQYAASSYSCSSWLGLPLRVVIRLRRLLLI